MWFGLENMLVSYNYDATLLARIPSPNMRSDVTESLNSFILTGRNSRLYISLVKIATGHISRHHKNFSYDIRHKSEMM